MANRKRGQIDWRHIGSWITALALTGGTNAVLALYLNIAFSGVEAVPMPWAIACYVAYWPNAIVVAALPSSQAMLDRLFNRLPLLYAFGLPILAWILVGVAFAGSRRSLKWLGRVWVKAN